jgi:hypothetical protein
VFGVLDDVLAEQLAPLIFEVAAYPTNYARLLITPRAGK